MPRFQPKPVVTVGSKDWAVDIPRPPKNATHARLICASDTYENGSPKTATLPLQDFGCFQGVSGNNYLVRQ